MGAADLTSDPLVSAPVEDPGVPVRRVMVRPDAKDESTRGDCEGESRRDGAEMMSSGGDSEALGPRPWNQGSEAQVPWSLRSLQPSYSSEFEAVEHRGREGAAGVATHHGLPVRKSFSRRTPERQRT
jgi:hypothetical protein